MATAQGPCPWLTTGTAAAALGGTPKLELKLVSPREGLCTFALTRDSLLSSLEIVVSSAPLKECPVGSGTVPGIGSEAAQCTIERTPNEVRSIVEGRVRDAYFRTALAVQGVDRAAKDREKQQDIVRRMAEQVAGNLF